MQLILDGRIVGECEGFDGDRVFEFTNGQRWQQAVHRYRYRYRYRPQAKIWRRSGQNYIELEGLDEMVLVRRIR